MRASLVVLLFISNYVFAHGNIDNKHGACTLKLAEGRGIHLTAYQASTHKGEVFCQSAPDLVETTIVLDFMEEDSKGFPFSFSIAYINGESVEPLAALPLALYPQGSMLLSFMPKQKGKYHGKVIFLDKSGHDATREFDFYVGELGPNSREPSSTQQIVKWLLISLLILSVLYIWYVKKVNKDQDQ